MLNLQKSKKPFQNNFKKLKALDLSQQLQAIKLLSKLSNLNAY